MSLESKIPTLLGLATIVTGLIVGILLIPLRQTFLSSADTSATPRGAEVANISGSAASVYWQTEKQTPGFIQAGTSASSLNLVFQDDRDHTALGNHQLHFVTLTNLSPNTVYYYKVHSGAIIYPVDKPLSFKTASPITPSATPPVVGNIIDDNSQPVNEAIITLEIPGAQKMATISKTAGSFALSLNSLYNDALTSAFPLSSTQATLRIFDGNKSSSVSLTLPAKPLPPVTLGKDLSLDAESVAATSLYDLNDDGTINSLDLSVLLRNINKKTFLRQADINGDGKVDQEDLQQLVNYLSSQPH